MFDFLAVDVVDAEDDEVNLVMLKVVESFGSEFFKFKSDFCSFFICWNIFGGGFRGVLF